MSSRKNNKKEQKSKIIDIQPSDSNYSHEYLLRNLTYDAPILVDISFALKCKGKRQMNNIGVGENWKNANNVGKQSLLQIKGKNYKELSDMKECPYYPRGYFIINGVEKIILIHEKFHKI